ncbi:hypothetical protein SAMD00019534_069940 [Acytostelium subglobosum LB1]|uniref:hypothetical protein n=1 Tax=Acytostelium subglobosum LB1 TaxID=1410327 RepID=UPI0006450803|nr:hypothetical protein SAMD00019534_069940 [Acytostelium subglobosum LB1]GAM23819.1 hypothetical protein SAMD00019534_069940 [Acytostelium subglobosum LB1]|eukprot:XP_012753560.1 hypothetical protein SAMD00019534_069940 [Acytostelium subglobosum LB1]
MLDGTTDCTFNTSTTTNDNNNNNNITNNPALQEIKTQFIQKGVIDNLVQLLKQIGTTAHRGHLKVFYLLLKILYKLSVVSGATPPISNEFRSEAVTQLQSPEFVCKVFLLMSSAPDFQRLLPSTSGSNNESSSHDFHMMYHYGMEILQVSLRNPPTQFIVDMSNVRTEWTTWLKALLLECQHPRVQIRASQMVIALSTQENTNTQDERQLRSLFFLARLLSFLPTINQYYETAEQFFCLLSQLLNIGYPTSSPSGSPKQKHVVESVVLDSNNKLVLQQLVHYENDNEESSDFVKSLMQNLIKQLLSMPIRELSSHQKKDHILVGILNVIRNIIRRRPSLKALCKDNELLQYLFKTCLFKTPTANDHGSQMPPLCKTRESRLACYRLIKDLAKNDYNNFFLTERLISEIMERVDPTNDWNYSPIDREKTIYNYVGLKNQGTTCYMNSLLQQLFHSTSLKESVLELNANEGFKQLQQPSSPQPTQNQHQQPQQVDIQTNGIDPQQQSHLQTNLLNQVQLLFIYLQESSKRYYDSINFCKSLTNYDGTPINLGIQMDAFEFFHLLLDKMEKALKTIVPDKQDILKEAFGGKFTNQFIPRNCNHRSHCEEPFYCVSLEVKNKRSVLESLDLFIQEESLQDYKCESCNDRVEITKRCLIEKLPNTLILHLKRFEFDLENMRNIKLNDYCEFPKQINMGPYTRETVESRSSSKSTTNVSIIKRLASHDQLYDLNGIVVHHGTADSGHYITLVKDSSGNWFELNDTYVQPYDERRIEQDCFGGFEDVREFDKATQKYIMVRRPKTGNAYMLFYKKINNNPEVAPQPSTPVTNMDINSLSVPSPNTESQLVSTKPKIPKEVLETVWNENRSFLLEKYLFDVDFTTFIWDIVNLNHNPTFDSLLPTKSTTVQSADQILALQSSIKLATRYIVDIYSHAKERPLLDVWAYHLKRLMRDSVQGAEWFIRYLVENRNIMRGLIMGCYFEKTRQTFVDVITFAFLLRTNGPKEPLSNTTIAFLNILISFIKTVRDYPKRAVQQLFTMCLSITMTCDKEREFLLQRGAITKLILNYIGSYVPNPTSMSSTVGYSPANYSQSLPPPTSSIIGSSSSPTSSPSYSGSNISFESNKMVDFLCYLIRCCQPLQSNLMSSQLNNYPTERDKTKPVVHVIPDPEAPQSNSAYRVISETHSNHVFSDTTLVAVLSKSFLLKLLKENGWCESVRQMIAHMSWNNKSISTHFFNIIKELLLKSNPNLYQYIFPALTSLLEIHDPLAEWRVDFVMSSLLKTTSQL